jgi:hypothetical protein
MLLLKLLRSSLLQLLVSNNTGWDWKLVAIRHDRRRGRLLEDVPTHLLEETTLASLVDGLQDVMRRPGLSVVSHRRHRHKGVACRSSQRTTS